MSHLRMWSPLDVHFRNHVLLQCIFVVSNMHTKAAFHHNPTCWLDFESCVRVCVYFVCLTIWTAIRLSVLFVLCVAFSHEP